jgi:hypothetical protein
MYGMYYASMLRCWQLVRILVRTNHPCLRVGCHRWVLVVTVVGGAEQGSNNGGLSEEK